MVQCHLDGQQLAATDWVEIPDGVVHVIAPKGATSSSAGHRIDGFDVIDLQVTRGADGLWQVVPGTNPPVCEVAVEPIEPSPTIDIVHLEGPGEV
ncbi:hypothetical protein ABH923_000312 [Leifsonia sp. EB41]|uniref:hypothetical protein n=1 Tax=Leifsonia sp. EB41 TaxID=3156260 RepID=UPI003519BE82